jgi:uncharacterized phage protein (TIGR02218 family)
MIELYNFASQYYFTSASSDVVFGGNTYTAIAIKRGGIEIAGDKIDSELAIRVPQNNPVVALYSQIPPDEPVVVEVIRLVGAGQSSIFRGIVASVVWSGVEATMQCTGFGVASLGGSPSIRYQVLCRHALYGRACGVDKDNHKATGSISEIGDNGLLLTSAAFNVGAAGRWIGGAIELEGQMRTVIATPENNQVLIDRKVSGLTSTSSFVIFDGCNRSFQRCRDKFNNLPNFGGIPALPKSNPFIKNIEVADS